MTFTTSDILRIAECAENGVADFYTTAAKRFTSPPLRNLCLEIAEQNRRHARYWFRTQAGLHLSEPAVPPEQRIVSREFQPESMVALTWLGESRQPRDMLTGREGEVQILRHAHRRLRDLATFYEGLKGFAANQASITMIGRIVRMDRRQCLGIEQRLRLLTERRDTSKVSPPLTTSVFFN